MAFCVSRPWAGCTLQGLRDFADDVLESARVGRVPSRCGSFPVEILRHKSRLFPSAKVM